MGLLTTLIQQIRAWETATKIGFGTALLLTLGMILLAVNAPSADLRNIGFFSAALLIIVGQGIIMWGNRNMVLPYTQAQQQVVQGDFAAARQTLETYLQDCAARQRKPSVDALTLLGNVQRQLGDLSASEATLRQALTRQPRYHFPLYGLGRTLLAQGNYATAAETLTQALQAGAPTQTRLDISLAKYLQQDFAGAGIIVRELDAATMTESHRRLLLHFLEQRLEQSSAWDTALMQAGLPFWEAESQRFSHTPYGEELVNIIQMIRSTLKE